MELLKSIVIDFVLFSGVEGFIFCLFFEKVGECRKFKWYEWLVLSIGNCVISQIFPPTIYQAIMILWLSFILYIINKTKTFKYCIKQAIFSIILFFIYEVLYSIIILNILKFDALVDNLLLNENIELFVFIIPLRILEISSIFIYNNLERKKIQ